jgi:ParB family chromosome partitioning protein
LQLPVGLLKPNPFQPRNNTSDDSIISLARSIEHSGILQPIAVRKVNRHYEIIAGERRWAAAKSIGMRQVPVLVRKASDEQMLELALIENIQREDLNAVDRARAYRQFCERFELKPDEVAARLGEDRTTVVNYIRLLDLPETILARVAEGGLSMGHARCLLGVTDAERQARLAQAVTENNLSVRALEEIVRRERTRSEEPEKPPVAAERTRSAHLESVQRRFEEALRTKVTIREGRRKGTGRLVIEFYSLDDFDRIADTLGVTLE